MIKIELASLENLDQLVGLFDKYRVFYQKPQDIGGAREFLNDRIRSMDSVIYVSFDASNSMTGFTQLYPLFSSTRMKRLWLLNDLYVDKQHRGKGISKALMNKAKDLCKQTGACGLTLETAKTNEIGNRLYPQMGFVLDEKHNYYSWDV